MRNYLPNHEVTTNYIEGMRAIQSEQLQSAVDILSAEPPTSACYGLALANKALAELRLERFREAETAGRHALAEFKAKGCPHPPTCVQTFRNVGEAISLQGRVNESLSVFEDGVEFAGKLADAFPDFLIDCELEKAHTFNSWGGSLLKTERAEDAVKCFLGGREIYAKYPQNEVGCAETLTNLAQSYTVLGETTKASLALQEAEQLVANDPDQIHRIRIANIRLSWYSTADSRRFLLEAAQFALERGFIETAYVRHCIAACIADRDGDCRWGMEVVRLAEDLEPKLDASSLQPPKLRFYKAAFLEKLGEPVSKVLETLIDGSRLWCERLPGRLSARDYQQTVGGMHDHFRKLGSMLVEHGRNEEAFVAFEIGRGRSFAIEVHGDHTHPLLSANPFGENGVDCILLKRIQSGLKQEQCMVSLAILPPNLVAFIVSHDSLKVCRIALAKDLAEAKVFGDAIRALSSELESGKGKNAIPNQIFELSCAIAADLGKQTIVLLAPHSILHKVPWRALIQEAGIPWSQLAFITQFSPLLDPNSPNPDAVIAGGAIALGHGFVGTGANKLDLDEEAKEFIEPFAGNGSLIKDARSADITSALCSQKIVLLSCHGKIISTEQGDRFLFDLADGNHAPDELIKGSVAAPFVILSACSSGVYEMAMGDYPVGAAPEFLLAGARFCICTRFPISAYFTKFFFPKFGKMLSDGCSVGTAFARTLQEAESQGYDRWRHLACVELLGRGISNSK